MAARAVALYPRLRAPGAVVMRDTLGGSRSQRATMKFQFRCAAALCALAGCPEPGPPDAAPRTITGTEALTLRAEDGTTRTFPRDLDASVIQVYMHDADGVYAGEGRVDGTLVVGEVPAGTGWLRIDYFDPSAEPRPRNEYFWIEGDADLAVDLGTWRFGRADVEHAITIPTELRVDWSGLAPWQPGLDFAVIYTPNARFVNLFVEDREGITGMPAAGATGAALHVDWAGALGAPLIDGDRSFAWQFRFREIDGIFVGAPIRAAELPAFRQRDGGEAKVAAPLAEPTPLRVRVAMDRPMFDGLQEAPAYSRGFAVFSSPSNVREDFSPDSLPAELLVVEGDALAESGMLDLGDVEVSSLFAAHTVFGTIGSAYPVPLDRADGATGIGEAQIGVMTPELPTAGAPARPLVGPVRDITVGGLAVSSNPDGVGLTPQIAWDAPLLGTPVEYEVRILAPGGTPIYGYLWDEAAIFHVPGDRTSFVVPPEVLVPELPYALAIRAIYHELPREVRIAAPHKRSVPYAWADTLTTWWKP
jgi:hypothetical protein